MYRINGKEYKCSVSIVQDIFNDKWKMGIIWHLLEGEKRYKDLFEEDTDGMQIEIEERSSPNGNISPIR